ncbi:hypothetical protein [Nocardia sp. NPDC004260]
MMLGAEREERNEEERELGDELRSACAAGLPQRPQIKVIMASVWIRFCQPQISM